MVSKNCFTGLGKIHNEWDIKKGKLKNSQMSYQTKIILVI